MYRKKGREWTKHVDFMLLDILCIQLAFIAAYIFRFGISNPYMDKDYRILGIAFLFIDFAVEIVADSFKNVLKRGYFDEFISTCKHVILVEVVTTFYLFTTQWRSPERRSAAVMRRLRSFFAGMIRESRIIIVNLPVGTGVMRRIMICV